MENRHFEVDEYVRSEFTEKVTAVLFPLIKTHKNTAVKRFFRKYPYTMTMVSNSRETTLLAALNSGNHDLMKYLLEKIPADTIIAGGSKFIDSRNLDGYSPLMTAVVNQDLKAVKILLKHKPNLNIEDYTYKLTALHLAAQLDSTAIIKELLEIEENGKPALNINQLTKRGGLSTLHLAVRQGNLDMVKFLVENGADVNIQTNASEKTAAMLSAEIGEKEIYKYLMSLEQTDKKLKDMKGKTALAYAKKNVIIRDELDKWGESKTEFMNDFELEECAELPPVLVSRKKNPISKQSKQNTKA